MVNGKESVATFIGKLGVEVNTFKDLGTYDSGN